MVFIYILQLLNNKYYIGKTLNPYIRIQNHFNNIGSAWTKKHIPLKIVEIIPNCSDYDEDKYTRIYMDKYGIENVRGGSFSRINLSKCDIEVLEKMSRATNNKCFKCGSNDHFANNCFK